MENVPKKKVVGRPFQKGNCANPGGREKLPAHIREGRSTSYKEFIEGVIHYGNLEMHQLKTELKRPELRAFDKIFATVVYQASEGDDKARQLLADRLWGKAKETEMELPFQDLMSRIPISVLIELAKGNLPQPVVPVLDIKDLTEEK